MSLSVLSPLTLVFPFVDSGLENSSPEEAKQKQPTVEVAMPPIHKSASTSKLKYEYKDGEYVSIDSFI